MTNIFSVEFYRLKKSKLFWVLFGVTAAMPLLSILLTTGLVGMLTSLDPGTQIDFKELLHSVNLGMELLSEYSSVMHFSSLMAVICTSIFLSREFAYGTFRNTLVAGKSRGELYVAHLVMAAVIGTVFLGVSMTSSLIFGGAIFGFEGMSAGKVVTAIVTAFAMGLVSMLFVQSMMIMFLFGTRKLSVALACPIVICMVVPSLLGSIVEVLSVVQLIANGNVNMDLSWVPLYNADMLDVSQIDGALIGKILLYLVPLTALFGSLGWVTFRKADLK